MIKYLFFTILLVQGSYASTISLKNLLDLADKKSVLKEAIMEESLSRKAGNDAENLSEPLTLFGSIAKADTGNGKKEDEYSIGVSKNILLHHVQSKQEEFSLLENEAKMLEAEKTVLGFENRLKDLYHQHCIDTLVYQSTRDAYSDFESLYQKKEKAYQYQEISKVELIQLQMEKEELHAELKEAYGRQVTSKKNLLMLINIDKNDRKSMLCKDMYPIKAEIVLPLENFKYTKDAFEKQKKSTQKQLQRYSSGLESIELSLQYDKELDMDRYSVGFAIPLNFTNDRSEKKRLEAMHQNSALQYRYEHMLMQKESELFALKSRLKSQATMIRSQKSNLKSYKSNLLPLIEKGYEMGEKSLLEFLLIKQKYRKLQQSYYQNQQSYYHTLFTLFVLIEKKDHP